MPVTGLRPSQVIEHYTERLHDLIMKQRAESSNEQEFRAPIDILLQEFCEKAGLTPLERMEYTLATGRADAVFNRFVIEYERPGTLRPSLAASPTKHAVEQVKEYIRALAQRHRQDASRIAGVVLDGHYLVFVRFREGDFSVEPPAEVTLNSVERLLTWLASLASGIALTAENLRRDFALEQLRTETVLRALMTGLGQALVDAPGGMVSRLFEQWRLFFSESIDYTEAFGGRKLEPLKKWVRRAGVEVGTPEDAERFFFCLHTYFALLVKLLAWLALSRHLAVKLGAPVFGELVTADTATLRQRLREMESGGIFRAYGILNLLEGDFFAWYQYAWNDRIEQGLREILKRLDEYDPTTLTVVPEETRDLFKQLYHYLLPRPIRHNLGEYYTPDWLAQRLLRQVDHEFFTADPAQHETSLRAKLLGGKGRPPLRWLDPACGSGTFLVLIIARMKELGQALLINEAVLLEAILRNVVGFDLNPLAVMTARVNYLLAIADLLEHRKGEIALPVYLADSVRTPALGQTLFTAGAYEFPTAVGTFQVPASVCTPERFDRFCAVLEESIRGEFPVEVFIARVQTLAPDADEPRLKELYEFLLNLHRQGLDGLWARLLRNNFAPLTMGHFDYIVGNPPWVNWEHLPDEYRRATVPIWHRYGLVPPKGIRAIMGPSKMDLSMLMTYVTVDRFLKTGGRLGFAITQSVFKTSGAGRNFRTFQIPTGNSSAVHVRVVHVDDMAELHPFEGATNRTAVMILDKGRPTTYPVTYTVWRKVESARFGYDSTLDEVLAATRRLNFQAEPVDPADPTSPWLTARPRAIKALRAVLGAAEYKAHAGAYTGGANAVYWVEIVYRRPDGLVVVRNVIEGAKVRVDEVTESIEPDLLYPLLRGRDVQRWRAQPSAWLLVTRYPGRRERVIPEEEMQAHYPKTYAYFKLFEQTLLGRKDSVLRRALKAGAPFYAMAAVNDYTFSPWKVVWREVAHTLDAAVIGPHNGKAVVPDHTLILVDCDGEGEAHYLCAVLNSSPARLGVQAYIVLHPDPHILEHIRVPRYAPDDPVHARLAELSRQAHAAAQRDDAAQLREIEKEIDLAAAALWGLTPDELREIQRSLHELSGEPALMPDENESGG
jgi:hypothetical protein